MDSVVKTIESDVDSTATTESGAESGSDSEKDEKNTPWCDMVETDQEGEEWKTVLHRRKRKSRKEEEVTPVTGEDFTRLYRKCKRMNYNVWHKGDRNCCIVCCCGQIVKCDDWRLHMKCLGRDKLEETEFLDIWRSAFFH